MEFEIRPDRSKSQGSRKLVREREEYFRLMDQGLNSAEACKLVGINYRTGKKWRNGHHSPGAGMKPVPPARRAAPASGPSRYLTEARSARTSAAWSSTRPAASSNAAVFSG